MPGPRIVYQNWIVEIGVDPSRKNLSITENGVRPNERVIKAVREAMEKLSPQEREFIERYFFRGESYSQIAQELNMRVYRIERLHRRAVNKLKRHLAGFVRQEYDLEADIGGTCPICNSPFREEIDSLIKNKTERETWRKIIKALKIHYNITVKTPQILIGHQKYHLT